MSREVTNILSTGIDIYNIIICLVMILYLGKKARNNRHTFFFMCLCITVLIFNIGDISNWIAEGNDKPWKIPALRIFAFIYYFCIPFTFLFLEKYIEEYVKPYKISAWYSKIIIFLTVLFLLGVVLTPFTGLYYRISDDNYYFRGDYYFLCEFFYAFFYISCVVIVIKNKSHFRTKILISFLLYSFIPICMHIIQIKFAMLSLTNTGMTISILLILLNSHSELQKSFENVENEVLKKERRILKLQEHTIISLSNLLENRDIETSMHAQRTAIYVEHIARQTLRDGFYTDILNEEYIRHMIKAAPMHDIGKIVVSDLILRKQDKLTEEEFEMMKAHTIEGARIIRKIFTVYESEKYLDIAVSMAKSHHEKWDGSGYPENLSGENIPLCARIMAIADVFDALVFERCYKRSMSLEDAFSIIAHEKGTHFDPILVDELLKMKDYFNTIIQV
ncbi:HD-GYP domain-containing protein [Treponema zioleckii]|uniref:HD-GYP domain-containing protein n=1 Tax=Treponema zioleckii TaxID=331680 RepID=UPI00168BDC27|nr:HD domain-containing phosphohydrolase [Treponema zioleckii]